MIIPAILPKSQSELDEKIRQLCDAYFSGLVQIDVCDGVFVPSTTNFETLPSADGIEYQLDLMVTLETSSDLQKYIDLHPKQIVLHLESLGNPGELLEVLRNAGIGIGLSISNDTPIQGLDPYIEQVDFIQLMGIAKIGFQGQPFDERVLDKIAEIRSKHPKMPIIVDGGVSIATAKRLTNIGATGLVAGSAVFQNGMIAENLSDLANCVILDETAPSIQ